MVLNNNIHVYYINIFFLCSYGSSLKPKSCLVQRHSTGSQLPLTPINKHQTTSVRNR